MTARKAPSEEKVAEAKEVFRRHGGTMRTSEALEAGVHPRTLYAMRDSGQLTKLSRGLYRLAEVPPLAHADLVTVALRAPKAVVCLISALSFHELTTQVPHAVYIAIPTHATKPRIDQPPLEVFEFGGESYSEGIQTHELDQKPVRIYSPEKTLADCFKFRNTVGQETAIEALKAYAAGGDVDVDELMRCARICRVAGVMRPYMEALL